MEIDSPEGGIAPMGSLHRAYPPMGLFTPAQLSSLQDRSQDAGMLGYDASMLAGMLPFGMLQRNVSPIISPCRTPTLMGSAGSSPDMDSRQENPSADEGEQPYPYNQLSSSPEEEHVVGSGRGDALDRSEVAGQRSSSTSMLEHLQLQDSIAIHNGLTSGLPHHHPGGLSAVGAFPHHPHTHVGEGSTPLISPNDGDLPTSPPYTTADLCFSLPVNLTSHKSVNCILKEIKQALDQRTPQIIYEHSDTSFRLESDAVSMVMEVQHGITERGVRLRKLSGDAWQYNKLCNELLASMDL